MLKEYIKNIQTENNAKLSSLEREMQELVNDLNSTEKILEKLLHDKKIDTNIFSPRTIDEHADEKIENAQKKIAEIKQRIEYVSQMIEEATKQKTELQNLEEEAESFVSINKEPKKEDGNDSLQVSDSPSDKEECKIEDKSVKEDCISPEELIKFLNLIYKKTETSLALVNGNKNRCKTELRSILSLIKEYAKKVENTADQR